MLIVDNNSTQTLATTAYTAYGDAFSTHKAYAVSAQCNITVNTPSAKTFVSGVASVQTAAFLSKASSTSGNYLVIHAQDGSVWAAALDKTGSAPVPTGAAWVAIASGNKVNVDISGQTSAADVATAVLTALNALTGFTAVITASDAAADGHLALTCVVRGTNTANAVHNSDDSGAGGITTVATTAGVDSKVNTSTDKISITAHGLPTGLKGQLSSTGTLPAGFSTSTDYFVIVSDANTIQLATSLANAQAGTAIDITGQGTSGSTSTFTPTAIAGASVQLQKSNDNSNWTNDGSAVAVTASGSFMPEKIGCAAMWMRVAYVLTAGSFSSSTVVCVVDDLPG